MGKVDRKRGGTLIPGLGPIPCRRYVKATSSAAQSIIVPIPFQRYRLEGVVMTVFKATSTGTVARPDIQLYNMTTGAADTSTITFTAVTTKFGGAGKGKTFVCVPTAGRSYVMAAGSVQSLTYSDNYRITFAAGNVFSTIPSDTGSGLASTQYPKLPLITTTAGSTVEVDVTVWVTPLTTPMDTR